MLNRELPSRLSWSLGLEFGGLQTNIRLIPSNIRAT